MVSLLSILRTHTHLWLIQAKGAMLDSSNLLCLSTTTLMFVVWLNAVSEISSIRLFSMYNSWMSKRVWCKLYSLLNKINRNRCYLTMQLNLTWAASNYSVVKSWGYNSIIAVEVPLVSHRYCKTSAGLKPTHLYAIKWTRLFDSNLDFLMFLDSRSSSSFQNSPVELEVGPEERYGNGFCLGEGKSALWGA